MTQTAHDDDAGAQAIVAFLHTFVPDTDKRARLVKANAQRRVYCVQHPVKTLFIKQHLLRGLPGMARYLLEGSPAAAELRASQYAQANGIAAIRILGKVDQKGRWNPRVCSTVSVGVEGADALTDKFAAICLIEHNETRREALATLAQAVVRLLATAHERAFLLVDLHPENLLIEPDGTDNYRALFVDLGSVRCGAVVGEDSAAGNLAALDQWFRPRIERTVRARFVRDYASLRRKWMSWPARKRFLQVIDAAARRHARRLYAQRDRRVGRRNAFFDRKMAEDGACVLTTRRFRRLPELLDVPAPDAPTVKGPNAPTGPAPADIGETHYAQRWTEELAWWVGGSPAWRRFRGACVLMNRDIPTVIPLACRWTRRRLGIGQCAWRALRPADGATLGEWMDAASGRDRSRLLSAVGRLIADTLARGAVIRNPSALRIEVSGMLREAVRVYWSGVEVSTVAVPAPAHARNWMLAQLARSVAADSGVSRTDRARVLRACCRRLGLVGERHGWKVVWRTIAADMIE